MPLVVKLKIPRRADRLDARLLVARVGEAAAREMSAALVNGYSPATGSARPLNSAGHPEGYRTGKLAHGLRRTAITGDKLRASTTIVPPADRAGWVASRGDVLVANGSVGEAIQKAADEYVDEAT